MLTIGLWVESRLVLSITQGVQKDWAVINVPPHSTLVFITAWQYTYFTNNKIVRRVLHLNWDIQQKISRLWNSLYLRGVCRELTTCPLYVGFVYVLPYVFTFQISLKQQMCSLTMSNFPSRAQNLNDVSWNQLKNHIISNFEEKWVISMALTCRQAYITTLPLFSW